jgi:cation diffusion facilitator CzcD-associated flavoprotein CzcO
MEVRMQVGTVIIGAGFSGIAMGAKMKRAGRDDFLILEQAEEVGGTWRDNTYPGCACDVPSHVYSFSFAPNPSWSSTFSPQPEIQAYLRRVAEDEGLIPHVRFGTELIEAAWDDDAKLWRLDTSVGEVRARSLVAAAGPLSEPKFPDVEGLGSFKGTVFHSARWDHDHDLTGERVAVVGTGASSIQFVPEIQPDVAELHLFQRTAPWIVPRRARPLSRAEQALYRVFPPAQRAMRRMISSVRELFAIPMINAKRSRIIRSIGLAHLKRQVPDLELRAKVTPHYAPGCKRILISNDYLPALSEPNVDVVTDGIAEVREHSVVTASGDEVEVDTIIFGTGFFVTEPPIAQRVRGADGRTMADLWDEQGMQAHRGTTVNGFPNLFFLLGPNTGLGHNSVTIMAEAQADYTLQAMAELDRGIAAIEPRIEAQDRWNREVQQATKGTVWVDGGCASWYLDKHGRNTTVWPSFTTSFRRALSHLDPAEYQLTPVPRPVEAPAPLAGEPPAETERVEVAA